MIDRLEYIKDTTGNNYIGVNIYQDRVYPFLERLKNIIGEEQFEVYHKMKMDRDRGHYHITVINVMEYNKLSKELGFDKFVNSLESVFKYEIDDLKLMGVGTAEKSGNRAYFIVVKSEKLQEIRKKYGLPIQDFHITIGFKWKDIFGIRKNEIIKENDPFLKLLKNSYYKGDETFDFIKDIENFDWDPQKQIYPIEILDTTATFRINNNGYFTIASINNNLRIVCKWEDTEKLPILSNTLITRKFKEII
jgi:hypothetical protein